MRPRLRQREAALWFSERLRHSSLRHGGRAHSLAAAARAVDENSEEMRGMCQQTKTETARLIIR